MEPPDNCGDVLFAPSPKAEFNAPRQEKCASSQSCVSFLRISSIDFAGMPTWPDI
jgi:hypothetical protein